MTLNLQQLHAMHPLLPALTALEYAHRAAMGLEGCGHRPGVSMPADICGDQSTAVLRWESCPVSDAEQLDANRITEDAAEAITLALVHESRGWVLRRRLQQRASADFLMQDRGGEKIALEVSGTQRGDIRQRMKEKLAQAAASSASSRKAAVVVELSTPRAALAFA